MKYSPVIFWGLAAFSATLAVAPTSEASAADSALSAQLASEPKTAAPDLASGTGRSLTLALSPDAEVMPKPEKGRLVPLSATVFDTSAAAVEDTATATPPAGRTPTQLDAAAAAIAPVTTANSLEVVELVEPGTGEAWLPAQSASALAASGTELAQFLPTQQGTSGWYVALAPEFVFGYDIDTDGGDVTVPVIPAPGLPPVGTTTVPLDATIDTDSGFGISGAVGYRFDNVRAELEVGYHDNDVDGVTVNDVDLPVDGSIDTWRFVLNGYYDFPTGSRFRPYVGGGAGLAILSANDVSATIPNLGELSIDDSSTSFLFQFKAGVGYDFTDTLNAFLGYRLTGIPGQDFEALGTDLEADTLFIHALQLGARYEF